MADVNIASFTEKVTLADTDIMIVQDESDTKKVTVASLKNCFTGLSAYDEWLALGNVGTESQFILSLKGDSGSPKGVYATLALLQSAFPTGTTGVYVVTADGKWYYWSGSAWVAGGTYQATGIADNSITGKKIAGYKNSKNLFNKLTATIGQYVNWNTGTLSAYALYTVSDYIPILPNTQYTKVDNEQFAFYNASKVYISGVVSGKTFTSPAGAYFIRICMLNALLNTEQLELGSVQTGYEAYKIILDLDGSGIDFRPSPKSIASAEIKDYGIDISNTSFLRGRHLNIYDYTLATNGYMDTLGVQNTAATHKTSDFMPCIAGRTYITYDSIRACFYDINKAFVSSIANPYSIIPVPSGTGIKYMKLSFSNAFSGADAMVCLNYFPTTYIPYSQIVWEFTEDYPVVPKSKIFNKKWNSIGDSIANWDGGYKDMIPSKTGVIMQNYAENGMAYANPGLPGFTTIANKWNLMTTDADIITIHAGVNDKAFACPIGVMTDRVYTTFYGALHLIYGGIVDRHLGKKIGVILPVQCEDNALLIPYVNAIKEVANYYSIPYLDLNSGGGLCPSIASVKTAYYNEVSPVLALHPNQEGHKVFMDKIISFLESL